MIRSSYLKRLRSRPGVTGALIPLRLPNLTTDVESVCDTVDTIIKWWNPAEEYGPAQVDYTVHRGDITREQLVNETGVHDRNSLTVSISFPYSTRPDGRSFHLNCPQGTLMVVSDNKLDDENRIAEYLIRNAEVRPVRRQYDHLLMLIPLAAIVVGYIALILTTALTVWTHLLILGAMVILLMSGVAWMQTRRRSGMDTNGKITFRSESRAKTNSDRAQQKLNLKVSLISIVATAISTITLAVVVPLVTGFFQINP